MSAPPPRLTIDALPDDCYAIHNHGSTVALVSSQGAVDWLIRRPDESGPRYDAVLKETHLSYVLGYKLLLTCEQPHTALKSLHWAIGPDDASLTLIADCESADGDWQSSTRATLELRPETGEWQWRLHTVLQCIAHDPVELKWLEYNNVYPSLTGCCFLYAPQKRYHHTLMRDAKGRIWDFPHQHTLHYSRKIRWLDFEAGTWAGFFGEQQGSPVVEVLDSSLPPDWAICDMYYDLHCGARPRGAFKPGQSLHFDYVVRYFTATESSAALAKAQPIPITGEDRETHDYPRLELGQNTFDSVAQVDRFDDASCFRTAPPAKIWDRVVGHQTRGSLRLRQTAGDIAQRDGTAAPGAQAASELVWSATPPSQIPPETELRLAALVKTADCEGRGIFLRVRYHTFVWHPRPHVEWTETLESPAVTGSSDAWTRIEVPALRVPAEHIDHLVWIDVVLDGPGTAWLTECDVDLVRVGVGVPTP